MPNGDLAYGDGKSDYVVTSKHSMVGKLVAALIEGTTPQPSAEGLRELEEAARRLILKWRLEAERWAPDGSPDALAAAHNAQAYIRELESLLAGGGGHG